MKLAAKHAGLRKEVEYVNEVPFLRNDLDFIGIRKPSPLARRNSKPENGWTNIGLEEIWKKRKRYSRHLMFMIVHGRDR